MSSTLRAMATAAYSVGGAFSFVATPIGCRTATKRWMPVQAKNHKFLGGALTDEGIVVAVPSHSNRIFGIDTGKPSAELTYWGEDILSGMSPHKYKWLRGIPIGHDVFGIPCWSNNVLKIDTKARTACTFADLDTDSAGWNWHGGALSPDGKIYGIPCNAGRVLAIDPRSMTAAPIGPELPGKNKWYGGIRGNDGAIYGVSTESHITWQSIASQRRTTFTGGIVNPSYPQSTCLARHIPLL